MTRATAHFEALHRFAAQVPLPVPLKQPVPLSEAQSERIRGFLERSLAANTRAAYAHAWDHFIAYCQAHRFRALPAQPEVVAAYLADMAAPERGSSASVSTIQVRLSGIAFVHDKAGHTEDNPARAEAVKSVMAGIRRALGTAQKGKQALTQAKLKRLLAHLPADTDAGVRDRAILLLGFALARRRSELAALNLTDVRFNAGGMRLTLPRSKTDQTGAGATFLVKRRPEGDPMCVVRAVEAWIDRVKRADDRRKRRDAERLGRRAADEIEAASPALFRALSRFATSSRARLSPQAIAVIVKQAVQRAHDAGAWDYDKDGDLADFSGHSLRAGYVTTAAELGQPEWQIQKVTLHRSTATLRRYIRTQDSAQREAIDQVLGE